LAGKIVVVGSFIYDLIVWLPYFPRKGETLLASAFKMVAGGKGFNQAVSARRCGAKVGMVGKVGTDQFGGSFMEILRREEIDYRFVIQDPSTSTSLGIPIIDPHGDNTIIGVPQANTLVTPAEVNRAADFISGHEILLIQLEIPLESSLEAARIAHQAGLQVVFNPTPAALPLAALLPRDGSGDPLIDWLIPNEIEAEMLSGIPVRTPEDALKCGKTILAQGVNQGVVITLGSNGIVAVTPSAHFYIPSFHVTAVDSTGAGDAFCGAFTAALSEQKGLEQSLRFACAAGALAVTIAGAEPSLPGRERIDDFLRDYL
jgi:ribokinase